jgi:5-deoxy-glucuronate isomerase
MEKMVFRKTNSKSGRTISVTPENSTNQHLAYGRIILDASLPSVQFATGNRETGLICLSGGATVGVDGKPFQLGQYDALYVPRDSRIEVSTNTQVDLVEFSADVEHRYPLQFISYAEISKNPALKFDAGIPGKVMSHRNMLLGMNVEAGRLVAGFTYSEPGAWASWPPHEHTAALEEMYVYFDMPAPAFGLQLVYDNPEYPEMVIPVRDGDAVLMPSGYHPNVSIPGHKICYVWAMAAHRERVDRRLGMAKVQADFAVKPIRAAEGA